MPTHFVFCVHTRDGSTLAAEFDLQPDHRYAPSAVTVLNAPPHAPGARVLQLEVLRLPDVHDFKVLAATSATRAAMTPRDDQERLLKTFFPLG